MVNANPSILYLEVVAACDMSCPMCVTLPYREGSRSQLSREQIRTLLLEPAARRGMTSLVLGGGEPTLRPDVLDIVRDAVTCGFAVRFATNLLHIKPAMLQGLIEVLDGEEHSVAVSYDSLQTSAFQIIRGGDFLAGVEANCADLLRLRRELRSHVKTRATIVVQEENLNSVLATIDHVLNRLGFDEVGVYLRHDYKHVTMDTIADQKMPEWCRRNRVALIQLGLQLYKRASEDSRIQVSGSIDDWIYLVSDPHRIARRCHAGNFLFFNTEGRLRSCMFGTEYADIKQTPLDGIVALDGFAEARKLHASCSICVLACN
ncbi:MAG TPA: radical SAM protein [Bryobacteraceae bacterium]|nr:radical SAM protein [Acidobacteriaceae bacterium]